MSPGDKNDSIRKQRKRNCFLIGFRILFGCASKKISHDDKIDKEYVSVSCQCQEEKELGVSRCQEEEQLVLESKAKLDIAVYKKNEIPPLTEEFRTSLNKLDTLINTLNDMHGVYKNNTTLKYCTEQIQERNQPGDDNIGNGEVDEQHLKFNINFDKNTFIQCHTNRGKHSLKIIHNSCQQNINPLILHRCESELLLIKKNHLDDNRKSSTETCHEKSCQLQRSYHTLSSNFGSRFLNLTTVKSSVVDHMKNIKDDVKTLRHILYSVDYIANKEEKPLLPFSFGEIRKWFLGNKADLKCDFHHSKSLIVQDYRFTEAKVRALNFCKFYTLGRKFTEKEKAKKQKKNCK